MVKQVIDVDGKWKVIVFFDVDFGRIRPIFDALINIGFPVKEAMTVVRQLKSGKAKGVTCSNGGYHSSVVLFGKHKSEEDYISSLVHEAEHVKQAMLDAYFIEDSGEAPAYTIGYLVMRMWEGFLLNKTRHFN